MVVWELFLWLGDIDGTWIVGLFMEISYMTWMVMHEEDIADLISFELGQPKDVEVYDAFYIVQQHPYVHINGVDILQHKKQCCHITYA